MWQKIKFVYNIVYKVILHSRSCINNLTIRGILLNGVFDAPARCLFQNMVQFNGFYGSPYCEVPGKSVQTSERGYTLSYPFNLDSQHGHHQLRTHTSLTRNAREAEEKKATGARQNAVCGVKGFSWFSVLPNFDLVRCVAIDYMHCALLGVTKLMMTLWFDKSHKEKIFSIATKISEVDNRLLKIKPPNFIARLPRSLSEVSHYKASELKTFFSTTASLRCLEFCQKINSSTSLCLYIWFSSSSKNVSHLKTWQTVDGCLWNLF